MRTFCRRGAARVGGLSGVSSLPLFFLSAAAGAEEALSLDADSWRAPGMLSETGRRLGAARAGGVVCFAGKVLDFLLAFNLACDLSGVWWWS